jgi:hypothetical protein
MNVFLSIIDVYTTFAAKIINTKYRLLHRQKSVRVYRAYIAQRNENQGFLSHHSHPIYTI